MTFPLQNKVILITGASSGIGRATAIKLSQLGASLALTDINHSALEETASLTHESCQLITAKLDVSDASACELVLRETLQYFKRLDHVFNCAGINPTAYPILELPQGYFDRLIDVNIKGVFNVTRAALPHMKEHDGCTFVNVSSIAGLKPSAQMATYNATKFAVIGMSKALALELGPKGIRVNIVAPGDIHTPTNMSVLAGAESISSSETKISLGRMGKPEEIADVVAFLMGDGARYMNGSVVEVNGGVSY